MNKNKYISLLFLFGCSFMHVSCEYGNQDRSYSAATNCAGGGWLSGLAGIVVGALGFSQLTKKPQTNRPQHSEYTDQDIRSTLMLEHKNNNCPSSNTSGINERINKQRSLLQKTNLIYKKQKSAITGKHKKRIAERFKAAQAFFAGKDSLKTKSYNVLPNAQHLVNKHASAVSFEACSGYAIQHVLHKEYVDIVNALPGIQNSNEAAHYMIPFADAGVACNKAGYIAYAFYFADFCWATIEGVGQGTYNIAQAFCHPINTTTQMSHGVLFLGKLLGEIGKEVLDMATLVCFDEKQFKVQGEMRLKQAVALCDGLKTTVKKDPRSAYRNTIVFGTEWFLFAKCLSSLGKFADFMKPKLQNAVNSLGHNSRMQYAFVGTYGNDIPLMEVLVDEFGRLLHRAEEVLGNAGDKIKEAGKGAGERIRKWIPGCSKIDMHMQKLEKIIPHLEQMYNGATVTIGKFKDISLKFDFKHVFGIELKQFKGQVKLNGFHFDPLGVLEKSGAIELVDTQYGPQGFYKAFVKIGEQTLRPEKTFFPKSWDHYQIMECVIEALGNAEIFNDVGEWFVLG